MILSILASLFTTLVTPVDTSIHTTVEAQAIVSDAGVTPFWMRSLQYGSVPMENPGLVLRAWNGKGYNLKKKYDWKYEVEATGWTGKQNDFWLTQAYVSGRRGKWELWAGRRKEVYGLGDTAMTSGFYTWSGNALPMPKVQLGTRDYLNFAKGWLGVHMTFSHGWFDNQGIMEHAYLHQKTLYARLGKPGSRINIFSGINHQVQWAGEKKTKGGLYDIQPSGLNTYFYVVTALKTRNFIEKDPNTSMDDDGNQYGNHLGSIDIEIKYNSKFLDLFVYKQSIYETGRLASLVNIDDGLYGISLINKSKFKFLRNFNIEYFSTLNQGQYISSFAKLFGIKSDPHGSEAEYYFNNGAREASWTYWNQELGTPLIILDNKSVQGGLQKYSYNAIKSFSINFSGEILNNMSYKIRILNTLHGRPYENLISGYRYLNQTSALVEIQKKINSKSLIKSAISIDKSNRIKNSIGLSIGLIRSLN